MKFYSCNFCTTVQTNCICKGEAKNVSFIEENVRDSSQNSYRRKIYIVGAFVWILQELIGLVDKNNAVQLLFLDIYVVISPKNIFTPINLFSIGDGSKFDDPVCAIASDAVKYFLIVTACVPFVIFIMHA